MEQYGSPVEEKTARDPYVGRSGMLSRRDGLMVSARLIAVTPVLAIGVAACRPLGARVGQQPVETRPVKLDVWHTMGPGPTFDEFRALLDEYTAAHPHITFELTQSDSSQARVDKIAAVVLSGAAPDVLHETGAPQRGEAGLLIELSPYIKRDKSFNQQDIFEGPWQRCTFLDRVWGVPQISDARGLWYNKRLFQEAGLDPNRPPTRWDELEQATVRLTRRGGDGYAQLGYIPLYGNMHLYSYIYLNGGELCRLVANDRANVMFTRPEAIEAAQYMADLYDRVGGYQAVADFQKSFGSGAQGGFYSGRVAMMVNGCWCLGDIKRYDVQMDYGLAPEPYGPRGKGPVTLVGGWNWTLVKGARNPDAGWDFLSWFSQSTQAVRYAAVSGNMPARKSALNSDYIQKNPDIRFFYEALRYSRPFPELPWSTPMWNTVNTDMAQAIARREKTARDALEEAAKIVQVEIDKYYAERAPRS